MPLYEYECTACHRHTEKIQKFSDPEITTCPHCGGPLQRVISAPAFALKGGGWYSDLYSSAKPGAGKDAGGKDGGSKEGGSKEGGGESKAAPEAAAKPASSESSSAAAAPAASAPASSTASGS